MRRFYSPPETFADGSVTLSSGETRHLRDVLRLRTGEPVRVFNGEGQEFEAAVEIISKSSTILKLLGEVEPTSAESPLDLMLAAAVLKSDKFDLVVQKSVELGVVRLVPLETIRSEARPREAAKKVDRWRKIALEATKQCGRAKLMQIDEPVGFDGFARRSEEAFFFTERGGNDFPTSAESKKITAFVGPEGGWDDSEVEQARSSGCQVITLGGRILRAETAAITVVAILQHRFGDIN